MTKKNAISLVWLGYAFIAALCRVFFTESVSFPPHDFANYYFGAHFLTEGNLGTWIYFPHEFNLAIAETGTNGIFASYAPNSPFLSILFVPFTLMSLAVAKGIFNILSIALFLISLYRLANTFKIKPVFLFFLPIVFFIPLRNSILFGQVYLLLFVLLSEGFLAYRKKSYVKLSIFWSLAIFIKVFPVLLFAMLLFRKKWKALGYLGTACIILLVLSIMLTGADIWEFFVSSVLPLAGRGEITREYVQNYQSFQMLLAAVLDGHPILSGSLLFAFKLSLVIIGYFITARGRSALRFFSYWMIAAILLSPYGSTYTQLLLIFPWILFARGRKQTRNGLVLLAVFVLVGNLPVEFFGQFQGPLAFPRLLLLLFLLAALFRRSLKRIPLKTALLIVLPVTAGYALIAPLAVESEEIVQVRSGTPILTYDYIIEDGKLGYVYWDANGRHKKMLERMVTSLDTTSVSIRSNQVFHGDTMMTSDPARKRRPAVINGNTLIWLSDAKQGIGFYRLFSKPLEVTPSAP